MLSKSATLIFEAARKLFRNWPALAVMTGIYAIVLTCIYLFVTTREATPIQVVITVVMAVLIPVFFFVLQTVSASYTNRVTAKMLIARSIKNSWKLLVVSLPIIAVTVLGLYLLARLQTYLYPLSNPANPMAAVSQSQSINSSTQWGGVAILSLKYLLIGLFAPLALIHLWIAANHSGLLQTLRRFLLHLARAFAARSVLIYLPGFVVFAVLPYLILFRTTTASGAWVEIGLLATRLSVVFCLTLLGWVVTVGASALAEESSPRTLTKEA